MDWMLITSENQQILYGLKSKQKKWTIFLIRKLLNSSDFFLSYYHPLMHCNLHCNRFLAKRASDPVTRQRGCHLSNSIAVYQGFADDVKKLTKFKCLPGGDDHVDCSDWYGPCSVSSQQQHRLSIRDLLTMFKNLPNFKC
jgi:hypothetical protein